MNFYRYSLSYIKITKDRFYGNIESSGTTILPNGTTKERALEEYEKMKNNNRYKNVVLYQQVYIHYEGEEKILKN